MENRDSPLNTLIDEGGASASPTASIMARHKRMERSCLMYHQRKIRCDKRSPCSHYVKADLLCCYPGPEWATRRPHKTTIADVAARVAQLERIITAISSGGSQKDSNDRSIPALTPSLGEEDVSDTQTVAASPMNCLCRMAIVAG
jgi:hypothetical protein